jgi:cyclohexa-1,5-dienecarbonyl-CoA hydratase
VSPVEAWTERDGRLGRVRLARPRANVIDGPMTGALLSAFDAHLRTPKLRAILLDHAGPHFSFGASVEEHLPESVAAMLERFHSLIVRVATSPVPVLVAVRGQCLGGGMELALAAHRLFAAPEAQFAQPEIRLGVFAPAASVLLPWRIGRGAAEDLLLSGRSVDALEGASLGLVDAVAPDPETAALAYFDGWLAEWSASSLRLATRAARLDLAETLAPRLRALERLYLDDLMRTSDALEGLNAFLGKRPPRWEDDP